MVLGSSVGKLSHNEMELSRKLIRPAKAVGGEYFSNVIFRPFA
jgi:hypothetical protein